MPESIDQTVRIQPTTNHDDIEAGDRNISDMYFGGISEVFHHKQGGGPLRRDSSSSSL